MTDSHLIGRRYINLVRCSTDEQADTSPADQIRILNEFAAAHGMTHAGEDVVLEGVSGSVPAARDDIAQVVARKQARDDFDVLLVQDFSRFTRGGIDHAGKLKWDLAAAGVEVVFVTQGTTGDADQDALIASIGFYAAQQQAKAMSYAATRGQTSSMAAGNIPHTCRIPYGVDRMFVGAADGRPRHRIRNLTDGTQQMLEPDREVVVATYGRNPKKGASPHYRRQSDERIALVPGDPRQVEVVRLIYRRKLVDGRGTYRIAKELNDQGVPSPTGRLWNTDTVAGILANPTYTGVGIAGRYATGIYHVRGPAQAAAPKAVQRDARTLATRTKSQKRYRPKEEWAWQPHPLLVDYLGEDLREVAVRAHEEEFERQARKAAAPKVPLKANRDKHGESPYLLKGLLRSRQGGHPMTGRLSGPSHDRRRYYAVSRAIATPKGGSALARMVPAEPLERAVMAVVREALLDVRDLRERIERVLREREATANDNRGLLGRLLQEREELAEKLTDSMNLGPASRRLMKEKLDQWEARLVVLERLIAEAESPARRGAAAAVDVGAVVAAVTGRLAALVESMSDGVPPAIVRQLLGTLITRLEIDLETRGVEMDLALPEGAAFGGSDRTGGGASPLCLDGAKPWPSPHEAQRPEGLKIASVTCRGSRGDRYHKPCFACSRKAA